MNPIQTHPVPGDGATAPGEIVLRHLEDKWVAHFHNLQDGGYYTGLYADTLEEGQANFTKLVERYTSHLNSI